MSSPYIVEFITDHLPAELIAGRRVLEVGSLNVMEPRRTLEALAPAEYIGTDLQNGVLYSERKKEAGNE